MSDIREEWLKLVLDELRKNNDKMEDVRESNFKRIEQLEDKISDRLDKTESQHRELIMIQHGMQKNFAESQKGVKEEHARMNDLLKEHMRRTAANEQILEILRTKAENLETETRPIIEDYREKQIIMKSTTARVKKIALWSGAIATVIGVITSILSFLEIL